MKYHSNYPRKRNSRVLDVSVRSSWRRKKVAHCPLKWISCVCDVFLDAKGLMFWFQSLYIPQTVIGLLIELSGDSRGTSRLTNSLAIVSDNLNLIDGSGQ